MEYYRLRAEEAIISNREIDGTKSPIAIVSREQEKGIICNEERDMI